MVPSGTNFYINATQQSRQIQEKSIKTMVANSEMSHEFKRMLAVINALVLYFVLYFVTA